ncbi:MAG: hypothetical protein LBP60_05820 [Spirochaetaceae bacterium]|jgi:Fic family protein|nr:hypothetical protein [Spirochaetaceae bacterium]
MQEHLEIINHKEAIDYIEELSRKTATELTRTDIFNIHAIIFQGFLAPITKPPAAKDGGGRGINAVTDTPCVFSNKEEEF